jgi:hypothetical protein
MRLTIPQSLAYMKMEGWPMSQSTFSRMKRTLKHNELKRLHHIAAIGFESQHLKRIDTCENIEKLMWENYYLEKIFYRKVLILKEIKELQPYISAYYDTTRKVLEINGPHERRSGETNNSLSEPAADSGSGTITT